MTFADALTELRETLNDTLSPYGWSDKRLKSYLDEGQDKFCEDTGYFQDFAAYTLATVIGTAEYAVPDRMIEVTDIRLSDRFLHRTNYSEVSDALLLSTERGDITSYLLDSATGRVRFFPAPSAVVSLIISGWRYAKLLPSASGTFEIPSRFHRAPIEWAAYKAFSMHDKEYEDQGQAKQHLATYYQYVVEGKRAASRIADNNPTVQPSPVYLV